jgi:hypothetical protein
MGDVGACDAMINRALQDIVLNDEYSYEAFVRRFDALVLELLSTLRALRS